VSSNDPRFVEVEEALAATLLFPGDKLATFICSFGSADISRYEVVGTKGQISVDPA
jgi:glucose-fructose oxidoreductase